MGGFLDAAVAYPTAIYTTLLGVVLIYWVMAMLGMVDFESTGIDLDLDLHADGEVADLGTLAGYVVGFGLIVLISWTLSCLAGMWVLSWVPTTVLQILLGTFVLLASFAASIPVTARIVRPMRALFVSHSAIGNAALVGQSCKVLTQKVDDRQGRAEVARLGASINIRVWADSPNDLTKGSMALILAYDEAAGRYLIAAEP